MNIIIFCIYIVKTVFEWVLEYLNYKWISKQGRTVPDGFEGEIDAFQLEKACNYTIDKIRFGFIESLFGEIILVIFIFGGVLNLYNTFIYNLHMNFVLSGIIFFVILSLISSIINIPFSLYSTFKLEKKYNFNTMTFSLWIRDFCKSLLISIILQSILFGAAFFIIQICRSFWWLPVWLFFLVFSLFIMYISPYVLEPLFNKFTYIDDPELEKDIKSTLERTGIKISRIFKMDASKRTKHSNAYFSGIGKVKRIVLFDTLLSQMNKEEIISVLAHEAGHWKKKHIIKILFIIESFSLIGIYIAFLLVQSDALIKIFSIEHDTLFVKFVLIGFIAEIILFPLYPLFNMLSRFFEKQADNFACKTVGTSSHLISALIKLCKENLANLQPHPLYAKFYYSHPVVTERIKYLRNIIINTDKL